MKNGIIKERDVARVIATGEIEIRYRINDYVNDVLIASYGYERDVVLQTQTAKLEQLSADLHEQQDIQITALATEEPLIEQKLVKTKGLIEIATTEIDTLKNEIAQCEARLAELTEV